MKELQDFAYLEMAYALAEKARGWASPNPLVGAVCIRDGRVISWGYHENPGKPHAEVVALERAGSLARESTLYVTLEPCVHWGRTPPCAEAVIRARPRRVVISSLDPNPVVFKKGIKRLRQAGLHLSVGLLKDRNIRLNEAYVKYITRGMPFITLKAAVSLDGRTAAKTLDSRWISSPQTREYVHLLRGEHDAIMVGVNTILRDDPLLTVRHPQWKGKKIARVILDSRLRLPTKARILSTLGQGEIYVFTSRRAPQEKEKVLAEKGLTVVRLPGGRGEISLPDLLAWLGRKEISSVLVEGGSLLLTALIEKKLADKLLLAISPRMIGGIKAPSFLEGEGINKLQDALELGRISCFRIGRDILVEGYF
ncbi:MAG: bifunctional diaminohydroxyphosphoribosylaminopyrimidine deaminase/5-amino-6-(5-phosphoribosylamino)uracil reductase RibD [Clostridiales bacterium]|nr:bifunctional diaminohydroxyphosphoribosylaminopyrimidine deaminase/5-amino-6-(5-phosphoribosylamino)uracil reductase RibD [Clostridiales bacterium]